MYEMEWPEPTGECGGCEATERLDDAPLDLGWGPGAMICQNCNAEVLDDFPNVQ